MPEAISVYVHGTDPICQAGVAAQLRTHPGVRVVPDSDIDRCAVAVIVSDTLDESARRIVQAVRRGNRPQIVLVAGVVDEATVVTAAETGIAGLLRRGDATADRLYACIERVAAGEGDVPSDLVG